LFFDYLHSTRNFELLSDALARVRERNEATKPRACDRACAHPLRRASQLLLRESPLARASSCGIGQENTDKYVIFSDATSAP
jgi:hypothetical protein